MSEDRLERALQEMKEEDVDAGTLEAARARVWEKVTNAGTPPVRSSGRTSTRIWATSWATAAASWWKTISAAAPAVAPESPR